MLRIEVYKKNGRSNLSFKVKLHFSKMRKMVSLSCDIFHHPFLTSFLLFSLSDSFQTPLVLEISSEREKPVNLHYTFQKADPLTSFFHAPHSTFHSLTSSFATREGVLRKQA